MVTTTTKYELYVDETKNSTCAQEILEILKKHGIIARVTVTSGVSTGRMFWDRTSVTEND